MALTLALMLVGYFYEWNALTGWAILVLLAAMLVPRVFAPLAILWFGLGHALGFVMSRVLLGFIFFLILLPVGLIRRLLGADAMQRRRWKRGDESVFSLRDHAYTADDLEKPY